MKMKTQKIKEDREYFKLVLEAMDSIMTIEQEHLTTEERHMVALMMELRNNLLDVHERNNRFMGVGRPKRVNHG